MGNVVTNVYVKFNYDRLRNYKASGNFRKSDNNKDNVRKAWGLFGGPFPGYFPSIMLQKRTIKF